jgi:hypothetical protein
LVDEQQVALTVKDESAGPKYELACDAKAAVLRYEGAVKHSRFSVKALYGIITAISNVQKVCSVVGPTGSRDPCDQQGDPHHCYYLSIQLRIVFHVMLLMGSDAVALVYLV